MASALADWVVIASVIALVIGMFSVVLSFVDTMIDYWQAYKGEGNDTLV